MERSGIFVMGERFVIRGYFFFGQYKCSFQLLIFGISWPIIVSYFTVGLQEGSLSSVQYTFIASENITASTQLLQLLETRYDVHWKLHW